MGGDKREIIWQRGYIACVIYIILYKIFMCTQNRWISHLIYQAFSSLLQAGDGPSGDLKKPCEKKKPQESSCGKTGNLRGKTREALTQHATLFYANFEANMWKKRKETKRLIKQPGHQMICSYTTYSSFLIFLDWGPLSLAS